MAGEGGDILEGPQLAAWLRRSYVPLRPGEGQILKYYVDTGFHVINATLRDVGNPVLPARSIRRQITLLDAAIGRQPGLPQASLAWRGVRTAHVADVFRRSAIGDVIPEAAFSSATTSRRIGKCFAGEQLLLRIILPAGISALHVPSSGVKSDEDEILLPRELGYEVRRIDDNEVEVVIHELA